MAPSSALSALRLLILSPCQAQTTESTSNGNTIPSPFPPLLEALTSTAPTRETTSFAGYTSHPPLHLKTRYYEQDVGIWCDELPPVSAPKGRSGSTASNVETSTSEARSSATPSTSTASGVPPIEILPSSPTGPSISPPTTLTAASPSKQVAADPSQSEPQDDLPIPPTLKTWKTQFLSPLATEVLASIGAIILILPIPDSPSATQQRPPRR